jgi:uncharacterized protein
MNVALDIGHPAQVHFYKNLLRLLTENGHKYLLTINKKEVNIELATKYNLPHIVLGNFDQNNLLKYGQLPFGLFKYIKLMRHFSPDIFIGSDSIYGSICSLIFNKPYLNFVTDKYSPPFILDFLSEKIFGFIGYEKKHSKTIIINTFREISYLHPTIFQPDPDVLSKYGLSVSDIIFIIRLVDWKAYHDIGKRGIDSDFLFHLVSDLSKKGRVIISSEKTLPKSMTKYASIFSPEDIHHLLYYSHLLITDSQAMTREAAVLGTPTVRSNHFVGVNDMPGFNILEKKYGLVYNFKNLQDAYSTIMYLSVQSKDSFKHLREHLVKDNNYDLNKLLLLLITNYPDSLKEIASSSQILSKYSYNLESGETDL